MRVKMGVIVTKPNVRSIMDMKQWWLLGWLILHLLIAPTPPLGKKLNGLPKRQKPHPS